MILDTGKQTAMVFNVYGYLNIIDLGIQTDNYSTLASCTFIHFVNVFFCVPSCSSDIQKSIIL